MGFEVGGNSAKLEFEQGSVLDGAVVRVTLDMSVRDFLGLQRTIAGFATTGDTVAAETLEQWEAAYSQFAAHALLSWNLSKCDCGAPESHIDRPCPRPYKYPATPDGFLALPFNAANAIFTAWAGALGGTPPNSPAASLNGHQSEAEYVGMGAA